MIIKIEFDTDNDAFEGRMLQGEMLKVLYQAHQKIGIITLEKADEVELKLRDSDGKLVGFVYVRKQ